MKLTLSVKTLTLLVVSLVVTVVISIYFSLHYMRVPIREARQGSLERAQATVKVTNEARANHFLQSATLIAHDEILHQLVLAGDVPGMQKYAREAMQASGSDFVVLTDPTGKVLARGHSEKLGDNIAHQSTVKSALEGKGAYDIVEGKLIPFTLRATAPVVHQGKAIGTVSTGVSLCSEKYVDMLSSITGMDVSIFKGDTRIMTTPDMEQGGQRLGLNKKIGDSSA